jgi:antagonist of KipI
MTAHILRAGFLSTVQDLGRLGYRESGVGSGGAADAHALSVANLLVGNEPSAAGLEITAGHVRIRHSGDRLVAWCGGAYLVQAGDAAVPPGRAAFVRAGEEISVAPHGGARAWLAISGGIDVPPVLGSRSTDLRSGFGGLAGRALADGDVLPLGAASSLALRLSARLRDSRVAYFGASAAWSAPAKGARLLRIVRGADWTRFDSDAHRALATGAYEVTTESDRMGVQLTGPELKRHDDGADLVSEAVVPGTVQVPPSAQPILLLADCQTIGGYPKIAHVITVDLPIAAQLRPGDHLRFVEVRLADAQRLLRYRQRDLEWFRTGLQLHVA